MRSRIIQQWLAGTLGGFIGWCLVEPVPYLTTDPRPGQAEIPPSWPRILIFGLIIGMAISASIAAAYGSGSAARRNRYIALGALVGAIGGAFGLGLGQYIFQTIQGPAGQASQNSFLGPLGFLGQILARSLGWAGIGFGLGVLQGGINGSIPRSRNGAIGGLIGGFLGGLIFALMNLTAESTMDSAGNTPFFFLRPEMMRGISLTLMGSAIGLFVGLTERLLRNAWVRVRVGRNEGQEYIIERSPSTIGRDELSDIPLFGDMKVAKRHANIVGSGGTFSLQAAAPGVMLNGVPVQSAPLTEGDIIGIAAREIEFHQKGAPRVIRARDVAKPSLAPAPAAPEGYCGFCGQRKDAMGRCACTPVASAPAPGMTAPAGGPSTAPAAAATGRLKLLGLAGPYLGRAFSLDKPEVTLGRGDDRDIRLSEDTSVSRRHARLIAGPSGVEMIDDGSSNGTFVNGSRITRRQIAPGDEVRLGESVFRLETT